MDRFEYLTYHKALMLKVRHVATSAEASSVQELTQKYGQASQQQYGQAAGQDPLNIISAMTSMNKEVSA